MVPSAKSPCCRTWLLMLAGFFIILGVRFALIERFSSTVPLADDWLFMDTLEKWANGQRDWAWLFERHNGTHLTLFSRLLPALSVEINGFWDARLDSFLHALVYASLALVLAQFFARIVPQRAMLMRGLVLFFFAVPFAGVRATWAILSCFDFAGLFAFLAFAVQAWHGEKKWALPVASVLALAASFSLGSGCMAGLAMAGVPATQFLATRRLDWRSLLWLAAGAAIFLAFYLTMGKLTVADPAPFVLTQSISAALKAFAWPVFASPLAVSALVPFALLMWRYFRCADGLRSDPRMKALLLAWAWLLLQAAAIGFMRGENGNHGIPSNRYNDLLMPFVFVEAATLLFLLPAAPSRCLLMMRNAWVLLLVAGVSLHLLWRTWPFMAHENGEYNEWVRQRNVRQFFRGDPEPLRNAQREVRDSSAIYMIGERLEPMLAEIAGGKWTIRTAGSMAGIPITFVGEGGRTILPQGMPPEYFAQPPLEYYGTFTRDNLEAAAGGGVSAPFAVRGSFLTFDLIVDKKARFTNYSLPDLSLKLIPESGAAVDVLAALRRQPPFLLRDRESVCIRVQPGNYRIECTDQSPEGALAFSAPMEGGRCAWLLHVMIQSSKLLIAAGIALLTWLGITRCRSQDQRPDTSRPGATSGVERKTNSEP